ncbi:Xylose isomerase-like TIM barrel [Saccharopolyspora kobensis]|uniref:Xylose isomerase-like TIM barrel n=1 Tax=Saccharopolyspora kobensis TaxID=146035 RepID=A0A1H6A349_9PSEU|nr:Xylose isomerase-like TIM barrel [Saccharopolyspora kobensis]SFE17845.1 Xylose isomerase-like TIM barrel [Saccharopolyspora kobensis]
MIIPGLASVTFRQLDPAQVVSVALDCGLQVVEWGGDVHVPAGAVGTARAVSALCADHGIAIGTYGSYYKAGHTDESEFDAVLRTAAALGAPRIRAWAGVVGSADADAEQRARVVADLRRCADACAAEGIRLTVEHHVESLTDDIDSAVRLREEVGHDALVAHWQPRELPDAAECVREVRALLPDLVSVHAFSWGADGFTERLPLDARLDLWDAVLRELAADGRRREVLLEFVPGDSVEACRRDAAALRDRIAATMDN